MSHMPEIQIPKIEIHNWRELHKEREYCAFDLEFPDLGMRLNNITQWEGPGERFRFDFVPSLHPDGRAIRNYPHRGYRGYDSGRIRRRSPFEYALDDALFNFLKNWEKY